MSATTRFAVRAHTLGSRTTIKGSTKAQIPLAALLGTWSLDFSPLLTQAGWALSGLGGETCEIGKNGVILYASEKGGEKRVTEAAYPTAPIHSIHEAECSLHPFRTIIAASPGALRKLIGGRRFDRLVWTLAFEAEQRGFSAA